MRRVPRQEYGIRDELLISFRSRRFPRPCASQFSRRFVADAMASFAVARENIRPAATITYDNNVYYAYSNAIDILFMMREWRKTKVFFCRKNYVYSFNIDCHYLSQIWRNNFFLFLYIFPSIF